jgi:hypothetical protein
VAETTVTEASMATEPAVAAATSMTPTTAATTAAAYEAFVVLEVAVRVLESCVAVVVLHQFCMQWKLKLHGRAELLLVELDAWITLPDVGLRHECERIGHGVLESDALNFIPVEPVEAMDERGWRISRKVIPSSLTLRQRLRR